MVWGTHILGKLHILISRVWVSDAFGHSLPLPCHIWDGNPCAVTGRSGETAAT